MAATREAASGPATASVGHGPALSFSKSSFTGAESGRSARRPSTGPTTAGSSTVEAENCGSVTNASRSPDPRAALCSVAGAASSSENDRVNRVVAPGSTVAPMV